MERSTVELIESLIPAFAWGTELHLVKILSRQNSTPAPQNHKKGMLFLLHKLAVAQEQDFSAPVNTLATALT